MKKRITAAVLAAVMVMSTIYSVSGRQIYSSLMDIVKDIQTSTSSDEFNLLSKVLARTDDTLLDDESEQQQAVEEIEKVIFIGDSRTEGLRDVNSDGSAVFQCKTSQGYSYMINTAFPAVDSQVTEGVAVVILMGVNDLYNIKNYINAVETKAEEWTGRGATVYYAAVGPVENDPYASNAEIESFNNTLKSSLVTTKFIDLYEYLRGSGYHTVDGTHYDTTTSKNILSYLLETVKGEGGASSGPNNKVWWSASNRDVACTTYQLTNWASFSGLNITLYADPKVTADISEELKPYERMLEQAAARYNFGAYVELFKALAMAKFTPGNEDIFKIAESEMNPGGKISAYDSIDIAAKLFSACIQAAVYPPSTNVEKLKAVLQAFEFGSEAYVYYCNGDYTEENAEKYAKEQCDGEVRTDLSEVNRLGLYDFHDQKFPPKVLKYYRVIGTINATLSGDAQQLLMDAMASWPSNMDPRRATLIEKGLSLYGKVKYSMDLRLQPSISNPRYLDCSSFVGWSYVNAGLSGVDIGSTTGSFVSSSMFTPISEDKLVPGDIGLKNTIASGGGNHVGIYIGKSSTGQNLWLHCTTGGGLDGIVINAYGNFRLFYKYIPFNDNAASSILGGNNGNTNKTPLESLLGEGD